MWVRCGKYTPSEGVAHLPVVFQGPEEGTGPSEHSLLTGRLTHESARMGSLVCIQKAPKAIKPKVREEGENGVGVALVTPFSCFPQVAIPGDQAVLLSGLCLIGQFLQCQAQVAMNEALLLGCHHSLLI